MSDEPSPIAVLNDCFGQAVPIYGLTFDKMGRCTSPVTRDHVIGLMDAEKYTDVIFFSHGWNNSYPVAKKRYESFLRGMSDVQKTHPVALPQEFKPIMIGVFWPSTILLWPSEQAPDLAGSAGDDGTDTTAVSKDEEAEAMALLSDNGRAILQARLDSGARLSGHEARQLAQEMAKALPGNGDLDLPDDDTGGSDADDLIAAWKRLAGQGGGAATSGSLSNFVTDDGDEDDGLEAAGLLDFDPRIVVRAATMWQMKDRAGVVGGGDVADVLGRLLAGSTARVHLVGHSYGCKVVGTALSVAQTPRKVHSMTFLQPAINHLAFAPEARPGKPGAFRKTFDRLVRPIFSTFSSHDVPLYRLFHLAARRKRDIGELEAAAPVSRFYALGGRGPLVYAPGEVMGLSLPRAGDPYPTPAASVRLVGLNGAEGIGGHANVDTPYTHWAVLQHLV